MSKLASLQATVAALLSEDAALLAAGVVSLAEQRAEIDFEVEQAVANIGICCIVLTPGCTAMGRDATALYAEPADLTVRVAERPTINRSRTGHATALQVAEHVACRLDADGLNFRSIRPFAAEGADGYEVVFSFSTALEALPTPVPVPEPDPDTEP